MSTRTLPESETKPRLSHGDDGDHERFSHYVDKNKIVESAVTGTAVVALCGKVWVPSRDPQRYPICPACKEIWESLPEGSDTPSGDA
ncbi:MAG: DUF3039 domain-containing protein [Streptosporangiales bacterium]|nr:DUF3039 domain-containing protein [Streptosporangiales bacterium]